MKQWGLNVLIALDQLLNSLAGGNPDETISSRAAKAALKGERWACALCRILNVFQRDHCRNSIEWDEV